jgi:hypothetical protein
MRKKNRQMSKRHASLALIVAAAFAAGVGLHSAFTPEVTVRAAADRVFELRTYTAAPGKLDALKARFRDHTIEIFKRHNMTSIGYWVPQDPPLSENTLIYVLAHPSREEAKKNWAAFGSDPEWVKVKAESEKDGRLAAKVDSVFMDATDFSQIK